MAQTIEAVILSGPRRGDIIQLSDEILPDMSEAEINRLNAGLDEVINALGRLSAEFRASTLSLKEKEAA